MNFKQFLICLCLLFLTSFSGSNVSKAICITSDNVIGEWDYIYSFGNDTVLVLDKKPLFNSSKLIYSFDSINYNNYISELQPQWAHIMDSNCLKNVICNSYTSDFKFKDFHLPMLSLKSNSNTIAYYGKRFKTTYDIIKLVKDTLVLCDGLILDRTNIELNHLYIRSKSKEIKRRKVKSKKS